MTPIRQSLVHDNNEPTTPDRCYSLGSVRGVRRGHQGTDLLDSWGRYFAGYVSLLVVHLESLNPLRPRWIATL